MCDAPSSEPAPSQSELRDINATDIETPQFCTVDFCLIPIGTSSPSVSKEIADVQRFLKKTGVKYSMHSAGTSLGKFPGNLFTAVSATLLNLFLEAEEDINNIDFL